MISSNKSTPTDSLQRSIGGLGNNKKSQPLPAQADSFKSLLGRPAEASEGITVAMKGKVPGIVGVLETVAEVGCEAAEMVFGGYRDDYDASVDKREQEYTESRERAHKLDYDNCSFINDDEKQQGCRDKADERHDAQTEADNANIDEARNNNPWDSYTCPESPETDVEEFDTKRKKSRR